ncbi:hypothetical protein [uncultured Duncaniella sp.]|uniref:hypothetical protein n=1 Tax=uncultured Duncaniella sp. TaxID=2768039 RepID=UPI002622E0C7|nr:hypothetical protein [uncultured Duncaniella sp.]
MILIPNKKILLVADFGEDAGMDAIANLKAAIESSGAYSVNVVEFPAMVMAEHQGTEARVIELCSRKLEMLSCSDELVWDEPDYYPEEKRHDRPDTVVVFGKSAMLAGGLVGIDVLFVNPRYDSEWPWKKQYYADRRLAEQYHIDKYAYENDRMTTVTWSGKETKLGRGFTLRYGLFTRGDGLGRFWDLYPRMAELNESLDGNYKGLADFICRFANGDFTNPLEEVYTALYGFPRHDEADCNWICRFDEPLQVGESTIRGVQFGTPMANGQSGYKLKVDGVRYPVPLESFNTRKEYNLLRDAILRTRSRLKDKEQPQRRILIVPDYFTPYDAPCVKELYTRLSNMDYQVAVLMPDSTLLKARQTLERRCKSKPFDLIVTLETGCLLAARVTNCLRIFVNPDWAAWEWMKLRLGDEKQRYERRGADKSGPVYSYILNDEEIEVAREMAERSNIRHGKYPAAGWFAEDAVESHLTIEHLKRFNTSTFIPALRLDDEEGIDILADQIHNILSVDNDE